jgi:hypothetical protein
MILVDTSAWIEVLRGRKRAEFHTATANDEVVTCLPVIQEVLQGFDDENAYALAASAFREVRILEYPVTRDVFADAVRLFREARKRGVTVRSTVDCLIAACALRNEAIVLHIDRDYDHLARVSSLRARSLAGDARSV